MIPVVYVDSVSGLSLCRYQAVAATPVSLVEATDNDPHLLERAVFLAESEQSPVVRFVGRHGKLVGCLLHTSSLLNFSRIPRSGKLFVFDLLNHLSSLYAGPFPELIVNGYGIEDDSRTGAEWQRGWDNDEAVREKLLAAPIGIPKLQTCATNEFYGHATILRRYCGIMSDRMPVPGRLQHGWFLPSCAKEIPRGETGPFYAWGTCNLDVGVQVLPIGSPYLYLPELPDPGAAEKDTLLAIPLHSIRQYRRKGWAEYAAWLSSLKFARTVCCLGYVDYQHEPTRQEFLSRGIRVLTLGWTDNTSLLYQLRVLIRQYENVTANRVCSAILYAANENRRVFLGGPVDLMPDEQTDQALADQLTLDRLTVARELGSAHKRTPEGLRQLLWGWLPIEKLIR